MAKKGRKNQRRPITGATPPQPTIRLDGDPDAVAKQEPAWHFRSLDAAGPWGQNELTADVLWSAILPKLKDFESMTWAEIESAAGGRRQGTNHHLVPVESLAKEARTRLSRLQKNDIDELFSLRLSSKERLYGIRDGRVFRMLWYDLEHRIYPVKR